MSRCIICRHSDVDIINKKWADGSTYQELKNEYGFSFNVLSRHFSKHILPPIQSITSNSVVKATFDDLNNIIYSGIKRLSDMLDDPSISYRDKVVIVDQQRKNVETAAKLLAVISNSDSSNQVVPIQTIQVEFINKEDDSNEIKNK